MSTMRSPEDLQALSPLKRALLALTDMQARLDAEQERVRMQERADGLQASIEEMRGSERWRIGGLAVAPVARVRQWFDRNRHHD